MEVRLLAFFIVRLAASGLAYTQGNMTASSVMQYLHQVPLSSCTTAGPLRDPSLGSLRCDCSPTDPGFAGSENCCLPGIILHLHHLFDEFLEGVLHSLTSLRTCLDEQHPVLLGELESFFPRDEPVVLNAYSCG